MLAHNGHYHAETDRNKTQYTFQVHHEIFPRLFTQFATAIRNPLFLAQDLASQVRLVDSEFQGVVDHESSGFSYIGLFLSKNARNANFGLGNITSLTQNLQTPDINENSQGEILDETLERLRCRSREWWSSHYCASKVTIAMVGGGKECWFLCF